MGNVLTACRLLFGLCLLVLCVFFGLKIQSNHWLQTDLQGLLPTEQHWNEAQQQADKQQEQQLNRQFVALVGHHSPEVAFKTAQQIQQQWQQNPLFSNVERQLSPDLTKLRHAITQIRFATLPQAVRQQLLTDPARYFQQYAENLIDPFSHNPLLPLEQDWLGFGRFVLEQGKLVPKIEWNSENGLLYITENSDQNGTAQPITWVLLKAELAQSNLLNAQQSLMELVAEQQKIAEAHHAQLLTASSALFAAHAKNEAEKESALMSGLGISLTLLLLFVTFRTIRVLWLFLPIIVGMISGVSATLFVFGQIHILTLVVGTSLIGVLIDFPLHWLSSSLFTQKWQPQQAMNKLKFSFLISLIVTLLGYALLGFTALPVLQQTALFSGVALIFAIGCTLLYLPRLFRHYQPRKRSNPIQKMPFSFSAYFPHSPKFRGLLGIGLGIFVGIGIANSKWQDDIRQWVAMPEALTSQLQRISHITGIDFGSQYFLITAQNSDELLQKSQQLSAELDKLQQRGILGGYQSLSQWFISQPEQQQLAEQLAKRVSAQDLAIFSEIGIPPEPLLHTLKNLPKQPLVSLEQGLNTPFGQAWQPLYLGEIAPQQVAGIVKIRGVNHLASLAELANQHDIFWQDKRTHLNQTFQDTRNQAGWLKALSFLLAGGLLWVLFGLKASVKMLAVPLTAILIVIAIFGYLAEPIGLFTMFGLLLVSAISIDYTAYMHTADEPTAHKRVAILLAGLTTTISFVLLGFSSTPAVATFGLSVSLGVTLSLLITFKLFK